MSRRGTPGEKKNPQVIPDLRDANLRDADLRDANLCDANLRDANLTGANLTCVNLNFAVMCGADLTDADLSGAVIINTNMYCADLTRANLTDTKLVHANLNRVKGILSLGQDSRGFVWFAVQSTTGPRLKAGCRFFTFREARAHWENPGYAPSTGASSLGQIERVRAECLARVDFAEKLTLIHGWMDTPERAEV